MDEVAYEINEDPLALRLLNLEGRVNKGQKIRSLTYIVWRRKRLANVLKIASGLANYGKSDLSRGRH